MRGQKLTTTATKAGARSPPTALKTYIPAGIVKALGIAHGTKLVWEIKDGKAFFTLRQLPQKKLKAVAYEV